MAPLFLFLVWKERFFMPVQINHPDYYSPDTIEVIDVISAWRLNFPLGSALKYIVRAGRKPGADRDDDLRKAIWYLNYAITNNYDLRGNREMLLGTTSLLALSPGKVMREWKIRDGRCAAITGIWIACFFDAKYAADHLREAVSALESELSIENAETLVNTEVSENN